MGASTISFLGERLGRFLDELGRRRVFRSALAYGAAVFVILQLGEIVLPAFGAPEWAMKVLVVSAFLGFPPVLCLAWLFDLTPRGIRRTEEAATEDDAPDAAGHSMASLPRLAFLAVTLATVGGLGWWTVRDAVAQASAADRGQTGGSLLAASSEEEGLDVGSLAVLPLDYYGDDEGGEYFAAGFHEELIAQLSQIGAARVVSRTSTVSFDRTGKAMPTIAAELGVDAVLEGSVFRDGDRVRITVQLIHGPTDRHLWANSYEGTLDDAIALQGEVAQAIGREIQAQLFPGAAEPVRGRQLAADSVPVGRVASQPVAAEEATIKPRALGEYRKGRYAQDKATPEGLTEAIGHYQAALAEDSSFAPAFAGLAAANLLLEVHARDSVPSVVLASPQVVEPLERAFRLDPDSPEAQAVLVSLQETLGRVPELRLPDGARVRLDSIVHFGAGVSVATGELERQVKRVMLDRRPQPPEARPPEGRLATARHLQMTANFQQAEEVVRSVIQESSSLEAWEALARLKTIRGDYAGAVRVWMERAGWEGADGEAAASVRTLESRVASEGEPGYWRWRLEELEARQARGEAVSGVELARAHLGVGETDAAVLQLQKAKAVGDRNLITLWTDPAWERLRSDARFREVLQELRRGEEGHDPLLW